MKSFSRSIALVAGLIALVFAMLSPAEAAQVKRVKKPAVAAAVAPFAPGPVTTRQVAAGPNQVVFSDRVVGTDPDPNIRAYMARDLSGFFGGGGP